MAYLNVFLLVFGARDLDTLEDPKLRLIVNVAQGLLCSLLEQTPLNSFASC